MQSRSTDMLTILRGLLLDLLVAGEPVFRCEPTVENNNVKIRHLDPRNTFFDYNMDSPYLKDSHRVVIRTWMTKTQILNKYGKELSKEDRNKIKEHWKNSMYDNSTYYLKHDSSQKGIFDREMVIPGYPE